MPCPPLIWPSPSKPPSPSRPITGTTCTAPCRASCLRIALGAIADVPNPYPTVQTVFQQLHNYPVGGDAGMSKEASKGNKNNITPVRREFLSDLCAIVTVDADGCVEDLIRDGLSGRRNGNRYGLPFLGDNSFLPSRLEIDTRQRLVFWYEPVATSAADGPRQRATRLTIWIDRGDMSRTVTRLYAPGNIPAISPPDAAWTVVGPSCREYAV